MAATRITPTTIADPYKAEGTTPQLTTVAGTAGDATNGNIVTLAKDLAILFENTGASPYTVTVTSYPDAYGRTANISAFSIPAGATVARRFTRYGWGNGNGDLEITVENVAVTILAIEV